MDDQQKQLVADILRVLESHNIHTTKIFLHKFIYFLTIQGIPGFRFEPYTYGPYSFNLASTIGSMIFWDEIKDDGKNIKILDLNNYPKNKELENNIDNKYLLFDKILDTDFSFKSLECFGTVLYCMDVISNSSDRISKNEVIDEFKQWKHDRYNDDDIIAMYNKIKNGLHELNSVTIE